MALELEQVVAFAAIAVLGGLGWWCWRLSSQLNALRAGQNESSEQLEVLRTELAACARSREELQTWVHKKLHRSRHDLMGCLNIVSGYRELMLLDAASLSDRQREFLDHMGEGLVKAIAASDSLIAEELEQTPPVASAVSAHTAL